MAKQVPIGKRVSWHVRGNRGQSYASGKIIAYVTSGTDVMTLIPEQLNSKSRQKCFRDEVSTKDRYLIAVERTSYKALHGNVKVFYYAPLAKQIEMSYWGVEYHDDEEVA